MITPNHLRHEGTVTAVTPIQHGDGVLGTTTLVRTIRVVQPDGSTVAVPAVAGNAVRGRLRRVSADVLHTALGHPTLTAAQFRTLYQGGELSKRHTRVSSDDVAATREAIPHLALWGWAGGGRLVEGRLRVQHMIPLCDETAHILPDTVPGSMWDRLDVIEMSRMEDTIRSPRQRHVSGDPDDGDTSQMRFGVQVIAAGTTLAWGIGIDDPSPVEEAWLRVVLAAWDTTVGGRASAGMGRLDLAGMRIPAPGDTDDKLIADRLDGVDLGRVLAWLG